MDFKEMKVVFNKHLKEMMKGDTPLFIVNADKEEVWNLYQNSFPAGKNEIFRKRREHDCSCCRHFFRDFGNVVAIKDGKLETVWNFHTNDDTFEPVVTALNEFIRSKPIMDRFFSRERRIGLDNNKELFNDEVIVWDHFSVELPGCYRSRDVARDKAAARDTKNVFKRSLDEISMDAIDTVLELIQSNTLYRGTEFKGMVTSFKKYKEEYDKIHSDEEKDLFAWSNSAGISLAVGRIRNHSIGTLLTNISEGMDLDAAVGAYEAIVAPANYKRPKSIFTKKMLEDAKKTIQEMGYMESLPRRHANLDDITVNNILFSNKDAAKRIVGADVFAEMESSIALDPKKFSRATEISIESFIKDVLPTATSIEALVENRHAKNFVSLIAPVNKEAKPMFKWGNGFSWAYSGNLADSDIRKNVEKAGGNIHGALRFSIQWNDGDVHNSCDYDAHALVPRGSEIYYGHKSSCGGTLDVDIIHPIKGTAAVENIVWPEGIRLTAGQYTFFVNDYFARSGNEGFRAEIEANGEIYSFDYRNHINTGEDVQVANVIVHKDGRIVVEPTLPASTSGKEIWGVSTQQFAPVSVMMFSPNYWDEQTGNGNRHYFFFLKDCVNTEEPNGFYNEFLKPELLEHKRVLEALGSKMAVGSVEDQLSGIGFSSTVRNDLIVRVKGATDRVMKIKF